MSPSWVTRQPCNELNQARVKRLEANKHGKIAKYVRITYPGIRFQSGVYDRDFPEGVKPEKGPIHQIHPNPLFFFSKKISGDGRLMFLSRRVHFFLWHTNPREINLNKAIGHPLTCGFVTAVDISACKHNGTRYFPIQRVMNSVVLKQYNRKSTVEYDWW